MPEPSRDAPVARVRVMTVQRGVLLFVLLSLVGWELWEGLRPFSHPWGDLNNGKYTDHFSHMNCARLFPRVGLDIWRKPVDQMFRSLTDEEEAALPDDVRAGGSWSGGTYSVPGWPTDKPMVLSWSHDPRLYPPGDLLLTAPVAALYHYTSLPFSSATRLLLMLFIFGAHVSLWLILESAAGPPLLSPRWWWASFAVIYFLVIGWTLKGFYDAVVLAPLALSARFVGARKPVPALLAYCVAAFLHFRAYFFAPLAIQAAIWFFQDRTWRHLRIRQWVALFLAAVLGLASLGTFVLVWPAVSARPPENFVNIGHPNPFALPGFLLVVAVSMWQLGKERAHFDMAVCAWLTLMMVTYRYAFPWHAILAVAPWLFLPMPAANRPERIRAVRFGFMVVASTVVFVEPLIPIWLRYVL